MLEKGVTLTKIYKGWDVYQQHLVKAVAPLTEEQLELRAAAHLRSIGMIATHIVGARARWERMLGIGSVELDPYVYMEKREQVTAVELVRGLEITWRVMQEALGQWKVEDLDYEYKGQYQNEEYILTRQWVIWHLVEHDMHHGGELAFLLGMHHLEAPDL